MTRLRGRWTAAVLASGWLLQALAARLWLTDSWLIALGFATLGTLIGLTALFVEGRSSPEREVAAWLGAARRGELLPAAGPGLRFDRFTPATDRLLAAAETLARDGGHGVVGLKHLVLAYLDLEAEPRPTLVALARRSLEERPEVRVSEPPARLGLAHGVIAALEAADGEAILAGADAITPVHVLRGVRAQLANPFLDGPSPSLRNALLEELGPILGEPTSGR